MKIGPYSVSLNRMYLLLVPAVALVAGAAYSLRLFSPSCKEVSDKERAVLVDYLAKAFHVTNAKSLDVLVGSTLPNSCIRKMVVMLPGRPKPVSMYLSDNHKYLMQGMMDTSEQPTLASVTGSSNAPVDMKDLVTGATISDGPANAPVTLVEFSDFQCPYCKRLSETLSKEVLPKHKGTLRIVFRQYPLSIHRDARAEAELSQCVAEQNQDEFWRLSDFLFANQGEGIVDKANAYLSKRSSIDKPRLAACVRLKQASPDVDRDVALGNKYGVSATPTFFINGTRVAGARDAAALDGLIQEAGTHKQGS